MARGGAREPVGLVERARGGWRRKFSVGGERGFERDEGSAVLDEVGEGFVEIAGWLFEDAEGDFDSGVSKSGDAFTAWRSSRDEGVRILRGNDTAGDASFNECVGAGRSAAVVAAGFESDVGSGSFCGDASCGGLFECDDFGVVAVVVEMCAFADDLWLAGGGVFCEDAAYLRIG